MDNISLKVVTKLTTGEPSDRAPLLAEYKMQFDPSFEILIQIFFETIKPEKSFRRPWGQSRYDINPL
jgi:hypothetical protein